MDTQEEGFGTTATGRGRIAGPKKEDGKARYGREAGAPGYRFSLQRTSHV